MSTPGQDREGLAALPPTAAGDVPADTSMWGGDGAVADASQERQNRLAGDEAQLRMPLTEQPHGRATQT